MIYDDYHHSVIVRNVQLSVGMTIAVIAYILVVTMADLASQYPIAILVVTIIFAGTYSLLLGRSIAIIGHHVGHLSPKTNKEESA